MYNITTPLHDSTLHSHRSPLGAARCGEAMILSVFAPAPETAGELVLHAEGFDRRITLLREGELLTARLNAPEERGIYYYHFFLRSGGRAFFVGANKNELDSQIFSEWPASFRLTVYSADYETPSWFRESVMYQIFPDRFSRDGSETAASGLSYHRGMGRRVEFHKSWTAPVKWREADDESSYYPNDFFGGTLRGIRERLPYLKSLGVGVIYLNPIFEADSNHRYNTADYFRVDPVLGNEEDFTALCAAADSIGIRILLDGVFSHTGADSVYFNKTGAYPGRGAYQGKASPYFSWFDFRRFPDDYRCWWGFTSLPEVREENPAWQEYIYGGQRSVVKHWLRAGASGYRLDVADELPDECLQGIYKSAGEEKSDAVIIGEVWEDPTVKISYGKRREYALGGAMDSVMNYPLRAALIAFARNEIDAAALAELLLRQKLHYPQPMYNALFNLLSSHDVPRIRSELGAANPAVLSGDRKTQAAHSLTAEEDARAARLQTVCAAIQFSLPGVPCIYYGDELGMTGGRDPFNRAAFSPAGVSLYEVYRELSAARGQYAALSRGDAGFLAPDADTLCVLRVTQGQAVLCAATRSDTDVRLSLDFSRGFRGLGKEGSEYVRGQTALVTVPAAGFVRYVF